MEIVYATGIVLLAASYLICLVLMRMLTNAIKDATDKPRLTLSVCAAIVPAAMVANAGYVAGALLGWWVLA